MTDLTKLADALELKGQSWQELKDREEACREAARILRAAGAADVGGLMRQAQVFADAYTEWANYPTNRLEAQHDAARAALESALRVAMAPKADDWIAIPEGGMPPLGEQVLVWCKYGPHWGPMVDCWDEQHEAPVSFSSATIPIGPGWDSGSDFYDVTHWRRIGSPIAASQAGAQEPKP